MVAVANILLSVALGVSAVQAQAAAASCPSGQQLIQNNKCCPGYAIIDADKTSCCVTASVNDCGAVGLCVSGDGSCKAKIDVNDSNYDKEIADAVAGTTPQSGSSSTASSPASPTATSPSSSTTSAASSTSSSASSDSDSGSSSSSSGSGSSSGSSGSSSAAGNAAIETRATLGMVIALAAVPVAVYGF
ncbi:hypothetical protein F4677DRAFT_406197 [Hypoxylon crocopeplum]|nr:hypothetical protein F4677DRAFT_406197 [Hypoxylon crocopeplum]